MKTFVTLVVVLLVAGCGTRGPERTSEENPSVSYSYGNSDELEQAKQEAAQYCHDNYQRAARVAQDVERGDERVVTFDCVISG